MSDLHVVLGAKGGVGYPLAHELKRRGFSVRTVQRSEGLAGFENKQADLLNADQIKQALEGAGYVYFCSGLVYEAAIWEAQWPVAMQNVMEACSFHKAKLIFLDNMYMYGPAPLPVPFDENTSQQTFTKKGKVRKEISDMLLLATREGKLESVIGRAADFYGPASTHSHLYFSFLERMLQGKAPQTLMGKGIVHTYGFTADLAGAMILLALDSENSGEVFHLPVGEPITIDKIVNIFNTELQTSFKPVYLSGILVSILSIFMKPVKEVKEMMYQFNQDYNMSWDKFKNRYPEFSGTSYEDGIREMIAYFKTPPTYSS